MAESDSNLTGRYDLSETALKALYRNIDESDSDDVAALVKAADQFLALEMGELPSSQPFVAPHSTDTRDKRKDGGERGLPPSLAQDAARSKNRSLLPATARNPAEKNGDASSKSHRGRGLQRFTFVVVAVAAAAAILTFWRLPGPSPTRSAGQRSGQPPSVTGSLSVADLAAGHAIKPGEAYSVDVPSGEVRIAVQSGQVAVMSKAGATLNACSDQPFVLEVKQGAANAGPIVSSCGNKGSFIQAVIPQPQLPPDVPPDASK